MSATATLQARQEQVSRAWEQATGWTLAAWRETFPGVLLAEASEPGYGLRGELTVYPTGAVAFDRADGREIEAQERAAVEAVRMALRLQPANPALPSVVDLGRASAVLAANPASESLRRLVGRIQAEQAEKGEGS